MNFFLVIDFTSGCITAIVVRKDVDLLTFMWPSEQLPIDNVSPRSHEFYAHGVFDSFCIIFLWYSQEIVLNTVLE